MKPRTHKWTNRVMIAGVGLMLGAPATAIAQQDPGGEWYQPADWFQQGEYEQDEYDRGEYNDYNYGYEQNQQYDQQQYNGQQNYDQQYNQQARSRYGQNRQARQGRMRSNRSDQQLVRRIISDWPQTSHKVARKMVRKYGMPDEATGTMLIWTNNGRWKRTIVYRQTINHDFPKPHQDVLEQFINYDVPADKFDELARFDGSVIAERTKGEISARCDREAANILALNLADDIINNRRSVEEARSIYAHALKQTMRAKRGQGQPPAITQRLLFNYPQQNVNNSDRPAPLFRNQQRQQGQYGYRSDQYQGGQNQQRNQYQSGGQVQRRAGNQQQYDRDYGQQRYNGRMQSRY